MSGDDECSVDRNTPAVRLKNSLMCGYDKTMRPVKSNEKTIVVQFHLVLKYFTYVSYYFKYEW